LVVFRSNFHLVLGDILRRLRFSCLLVLAGLASLLISAGGAWSNPTPDKAPPGDFGAIVKAQGAGGKRGVPLVLRVGNTRRWTATSVQACASVPLRRARVTTASDNGSVRFEGRRACWIVRQIKPHRTVSLRFAVKPRHGGSLPRISVRVNGGNSNSLSVPDALLRLPAGKHRHRHGGHAAASATTCTTPSKLGVVFVTDDSGSMELSDPTHLRARAVAVGLDQLPDGSLAAETSFNEFSEELFGVTSVDASSRPTLKAAATRLYDYGNTDYEEAFLGGRAELAKMAGADKKAIVFLSDGAPNSLAFNADEQIAATGTPIYTIGLGVAGNPEAEAILGHIAAGSGAQYYSAESAGQLQPIFARIVAALTCGAETLSETFPLAPGASRSVPFTIEPNDGEFRALAAWSSGKVSVTAQRPDSTTMAPGSTLTGEALVNEPTYALLTAKDPLVGPWQLKLTADQTNIGDVDVSIDVFKKGIPDPPPPPPAEGRHLDPCIESFPGPVKSKDFKAFGGKKTVFDRASSMYQVCAGWGLPDGVQLKPEMQCAMIAAMAIMGGPPYGWVTNLACNSADIVAKLRGGNWLGAAKSASCGYFADIFATRVGIMAAGATAELGPGAIAVGLLTYRTLASSLGVVCAGGLNGGLQQLGINLESDHQTDVALDVIREGKCLARKEGPFHSISWSAVDCP
jgi:von Willebrand factor type A domain-containing protein